jgi:hypothetical protein
MVLVKLKPSTPEALLSMLLKDKPLDNILKMPMDKELVLHQLEPVMTTDSKLLIHSQRSGLLNSDTHQLQVQKVHLQDSHASMEMILTLDGEPLPQLLIMVSLSMMQMERESHSLLELAQELKLHLNYQESDKPFHGEVNHLALEDTTFTVLHAGDDHIKHKLLIHSFIHLNIKSLKTIINNSIF